MRLAVIADSHFDQHSRFEECIRLHNAIADDCARRGIDAFAHAGDVFERRSTATEREYAFAWFQRMAEFGPGIVVRGNHDEVENLPLLERLETKHSITVVEDARVVRLAGAAVACIAWPRKAALLAAFGSQSMEDGERSAGDALRAVYRGLGAELAAHDGPRLVLMHAMVRGSVTSVGQPLVGCDLEVGLEDLALLNAHAYLLGHIHRQQSWSIGDAPVIYPGSPRRTAFGEVEDKGYTLLTIEGESVSAELVPLPATPMHHVSAVWQSGGFVTDYNEAFAGAEIRFRYTVASDQRDAAAAQAERIRQAWLNGGAVSVKVEPIVIAEQRARAPELAKAHTLQDKLVALWAAKSFDPGERRVALIDKVHQLEEIAHAS